MGKKKTLTTAAGIPVPDNQTSLTAGERGPTLMQDHYLLEKLAHFNRERIPERVVHAKAAGAHGTLTVTHDITQYTKAKLRNREEDGNVRPVLHRGRREGFSRHGTGCSRFRPEVLHGRGQLGHGRQQHAGFLHS